MRIIVSGAIGRSYVGGQAWVYMQYLAGLRELGHDVYYLEDCGEESWVYHWEEQQLTTDLDYPAAYVNDCLALIGFGDRWIYRAGADSRGMPMEQFEQLCSGADLLLVRAVPLTVWRREYDLPRRRAFIDVDPGFTQISLLNGEPTLTSTVNRCERLFTYGQGIGRPDCLMPTAGREWLKTVPPVALAYWPVAEEA
ncbi:MAG TPA: glycosyltransferase family 1 protein, partial [Chloroflexia bacterium]|nr:glycosyltransferase family 1 protein [Chloroflexia bacterium]